MFSSGVRSGALSMSKGGGTDPAALEWARRVAAAGGTMGLRTLTATSTFCRSAKLAGYWSKLVRLNLFCGDSLTAALVPLKVGGGNATETNVNFVAGDYTEATGLTSDGSTKYLRTGLLASALTLNDTHLAMYNRGTSAQRSAIGANDATNYLQFLCPFSVGVHDSYQYNTVAGLLEPANSGSPFGLMVSSRVSSSSHVVYKNGASIGSNATVGGTLPALEFFVMASNASATANFVSQAQCSGYSIGSGLSAADVTAYNTHMQAFQTSLGRNV